MAPPLPVVGVGHVAARTGADALGIADAFGLEQVLALVFFLVSLLGVLSHLQGSRRRVLLPGQAGYSPVKGPPLGKREGCCLPDQKLEFIRL